MNDSMKKILPMACDPKYSTTVTILRIVENLSLKVEGDRK